MSKTDNTNKNKEKAIPSFKWRWPSKNPVTLEQKDQNDIIFKRSLSKKIISIKPHINFKKSIKFKWIIPSRDKSILSSDKTY